MRRARSSYTHFPCFVISPADARCYNKSCTDNSSRWLVLQEYPILSNLQFCLPLGWRLPHSWRRIFFLCNPSNTIMGRVPHTSLFMYHQSTAPAPPPDLPPVVAPVVADPVSSAGPSRACSYDACCCASSCGSNAYSADGTFCTSHVHTGPGCSDVVGDHLEECMYLHEAWPQVQKWAADKKFIFLKLNWLKQ